METNADLDEFADRVAKTLNYGMDDDDRDEAYEDDKDISSGNVALKKWDAQPVEIDDMEEIRSENQFFDKQINDSDLIICNPTEYVSLYNAQGPVGLFFLFIPPVFIDQYMKKEIQAILDAKESKRATKSILTPNKIWCVIGLDIAMSLSNSTTMKELWSTKMFLGNASFGECMSRDEFVAIRGSLRTYAEESPGSLLDPLWTAHPAMNHVICGFSKVAYIQGPIALDEASCPTKARNSASVYCPHKPDKWAIRFYATTGWQFFYTLCLCDNGAGNKTRLSPLQRFVQFFGNLQAAFNQFTQPLVHPGRLKTHAQSKRIEPPCFG